MRFAVLGLIEAMPALMQERQESMMAGQAAGEAAGRRAVERIVRQLGELGYEPVEEI